MGKKGKFGVVISLGLLASFLLMFPFNLWLSSTMVRHQIIQLPLAVMIGILLGFSYRNLRINDIYWRISALIFSIFSFSFWMLPHSIDISVVFPVTNRIMILNMVVVGFLIIISLRKTYMELKIVFLGMLTAMLFATGITLQSLKILLCSSYSVAQQHETGFYILLFATALFFTTFTVFFNGLANAKTAHLS